MYYVIENQHRPDGIINHSSTPRQNMNSAISLFHERISKMSMNEEFTSVALSLEDANLNQIDHRIVETMYPKPVTEPVEE